MKPLQKCRAFSLIESAIVLGIIGLVVGGIWAATAKIQRRMAINHTSALLSTMVETYRKQYGTIKAGSSYLTALLNNPHLPPSYKYDQAAYGWPYVYGNGVITEFAYDSSNLLWGSFYFADYPAWNNTPQPDICLDLSKTLLRLANSSSALVRWSHTGGPTTWNQGSTAPNTQQIISMCTTTTELAFSGLLP